MSETSSTNFVLETSGFAVLLPNAVMQNSGNINLSLAVNGSPDSLSVFVEGLNSPSSANTDYGAQPGTPTALATITYSGTSKISQSVALNGVLYDTIRVTGVWTGTGVTVNASVTMAGNGQQFSSSQLGAIQSYSA